MKKNLIITILTMFVFLTTVSAYSKNVPDGFWSAPISLSNYATGFNKEITPDIIFRKAIFKDQDNGTNKLKASVEKYSYDGELITVIINIKMNNKPLLRMITKFVYNKEQELNYIKSVFAKNYSSGDQMDISYKGKIEGINEYNSKKLGEVMGGFWEIMKFALDPDYLEKLKKGPEKEAEIDESSTNDSIENNETNKENTENSDSDTQSVD